MGVRRWTSVDFGQARSPPLAVPLSGAAVPSPRLAIRPALSGARGQNPAARRAPSAAARNPAAQIYLAFERGRRRGGGVPLVQLVPFTPKGVFTAERTT